jgi:hypothetical protein
MMVSWKKVQLGQICSFKYGQMPNKADLRDVGYPVFSGYGIVGASTKFHYETPQIIVVARGVGGTGDVKMSPPFCFLTNLSIAVLPNDPEVDKAFLYYRLAGPKLWDLRTGSAQAQITIERLRIYEIELPEPSGASSGIGLPTGWKIEPLGSVAHVIMGQSPPSAELNTDGAGLVFHQGVTDFGALFTGRRVFCSHLHGKRIAEAGDILFSVRAPVGRINCASERTVLGRGVAAIQDNSGERAYLLAHLRAMFHTTDLIGTGAIYRAVKRGDVEGYQLFVLLLR